MMYGIGTDATIAEHINKIIEREYVMKQKSGNVEYLVPSTLGIGLVEGYNTIGFEKSLCKPHLRRQVSFIPLSSPPHCLLFLSFVALEDSLMMG